jgi:serine-type D-Ala-D-Ala carboxypeptidase/endopeptidase (penicillin-binding protein 4)
VKSLKSLLILCIFIAPLEMLAAPTLNASCELLPNGNIVSDNPHQPFVIASLSKLFTSQWALQHFGSQHRFKTTVYITLRTGNSYDVHLSGTYDPTWGREMMHFLASELQRHGVEKIHTLSFDEKFFLNWRSKAHTVDGVNHYYDFVDLAGAETVFPTKDVVLASLKTHFIPRKKEFQKTVLLAKKVGLNLEPSIRLKKPQKIDMISSVEFKPNLSNSSFIIESLPLLEILKRMNLTSNNTIADILFWQMGGASGFKEDVFALQLGEYENSIDLRNGSGYPIKSENSKFYNQASCISILHTLHNMENILLAEQSGLEHILAVATSDESTLDKYQLPPNLVIAKTGTVNPSVGLAGSVHTPDGPTYFSYLIGTDSASDWEEARETIQSHLSVLLQNEVVNLNYTPPESVSFLSQNQSAH